MMVLVGLLPPEKVLLFIARGALRAFELVMRAIAGAVDPGAPADPLRGDTSRGASGRVCTVAGTVEPVDYDENGQRVGASTRSPAVKDA